MGGELDRVGSFRRNLSLTIDNPNDERGMNAAEPEVQAVATASAAQVEAALHRELDGIEQMTYEDLKSGALPNGMDVTHKEAYLSDEEFREVFGMIKAEFYALSEASQEERKRAAGL